MISETQRRFFQVGNINGSEADKGAVDSVVSAARLRLAGAIARVTGLIDASVDRVLGVQDPAQIAIDARLRALDLSKVPNPNEPPYEQPYA